MCPPKPPKVVNPAAAPAPPAQGADALILGGSGVDTTDQMARQGLIGRSLLRVGRGAPLASPGSGTVGSSSGVGASPGSSLGVGPSSGGTLSSGSSSGGSAASPNSLAVGGGGGGTARGLRVAD